MGERAGEVRRYARAVLERITTGVPPEIPLALTRLSPVQEEFVCGTGAAAEAARRHGPILCLRKEGGTASQKAPR
jgi:hypothetical protein